MERGLIHGIEGVSNRPRENAFGKAAPGRRKAKRPVLGARGTAVDANRIDPSRRARRRELEVPRIICTACAGVAREVLANISKGGIHARRVLDCRMARQIRQPQLRYSVAITRLLTSLAYERR